MKSAENGTPVVILFGHYAGCTGRVVSQLPRTGEVRVRLTDGPERTYRLVSLQELSGSEVQAADLPRRRERRWRRRSA